MENVKWQGWSTLAIIFGKRFWDSYTLKNFTYCVYLFLTNTGVLLALIFLRVESHLSCCPVTSQGRNQWVILGVNGVYRLVQQFSSENKDINCSGVWGLQDSANQGLTEVLCWMKAVLSEPCCGHKQLLFVSQLLPLLDLCSRCWNLLMRKGLMERVIIQKCIKVRGVKEQRSFRCH